MQTCACCGQVIEASARATVQVDDELLRLCNEAFAEAEQRGQGQVEVAHLLVCLARSTVGRAGLERAGVSRLALHEACLDYLGGLASQRQGERTRTADDLKELLRLAEQRAQAEQRAFATPADLVDAMIAEGRRIASVAVVAVWGARPDLAQPPAARTEAPEISAGARAWPRRDKQLELELRRGSPPVRPCRADHGDGNRAQSDAFAARQQTAPHFTRASSVEPGRSPGRRDGVEDGDQAGTRQLLEHLRQQDRQLGELRALVGRLLDRQAADDEDDGSVRAGRRGRASRSALRWARISERDPGSRARSRRSGGQRAAYQSHDGWSTAGRLPRAPREDDRRERTLRQASLRDSAHGEAAYADPLNGPPDNDTEDDGGGGNGRMKRFYLSPDDDIVKAPSIGPRTAARLIPLGLVLVRDLLNCNAEQVAERVGARYINAARINEWKAQARLVCTIPWLRGMHAQLLVGAGFDTLTKLVRADASAVCAAVLRFSTTREGQSILRSGPPPEIDRIACWIENTALAEPARAA